MNAGEILKKAVEERASDIFIIPGTPHTYKIDGVITPRDTIRLKPEDTDAFVREVYALARGRSMKKLEESGDDDFSFALPGVSRFRANAFKQRGSYAAVIRVVRFELPDYRALHIPQAVIDVAKLKRGFVVVTGPAGSGKTTTLACIINEINRTRSAHIITLEDPIEYLHRHQQSVVTQREITTDTESYATALRAALRQSPDVILLGEMRDYETIQTAMTAAETGHLVISTLQTLGAANTIDRIIDVFPPNQQRQIRAQLAMVMMEVISMQLVPTVGNSLVPVFEVVPVTNAIRNMIRETKLHQLDAVIGSSQDSGMISMDASLAALYKNKTITKETALLYCQNKDVLERKLARGL